MWFLTTLDDLGGLYQLLEATR